MLIPLVRVDWQVGRGRPVGARHAQRLAADAPVAAAHLFDEDPGDASHVLSFDGDHRIGEALDDLSLLLGREHVLDQLDVDKRHCCPPWLVFGETRWL
jgi:hypothetical protein